VILRHARTTVLLREVFRTAIRSTDRVDALEVVIGDRTGPSGVSGCGYATATPAITGDTLESMEAFLDSHVADWLAGTEPVAEGIVENVAAARLDLERFSGESPSGAAGVDLALADLQRQLVGAVVAPVSVLTSVTISAGSPGEMAASARTRINQGFRTIKCKLGVDPAGDFGRLAAVDRMRTELDPSVALWVDANQGWTIDETLRFVDAAVAAEIVLERLEQPTLSGDFEALAKIRGRIPMLLVADESAKTLADIDRLASLGAADFINIKVMKFGGLLGSERAIAQSRLHGLGILVGSMMEHPESVGAAVRLASVQPELVHDLDAGWWALDTNPLRYDKGYVHV
jgi:L-Ala-D/L-Glu epimerase